MCSFYQAVIKNATPLSLSMNSFQTAKPANMTTTEKKLMRFIWHCSAIAFPSQQFLRWQFCNLLWWKKKLYQYHYEALVTCVQFWKKKQFELETMFPVIHGYQWFPCCSQHFTNLLAQYREEVSGRVSSKRLT